MADELDNIASLFAATKEVKGRPKVGDWPPGAQRKWYIAIRDANIAALDDGAGTLDLGVAVLSEAASLLGYEDPWKMLAAMKSGEESE